MKLHLLPTLFLSVALFVSGCKKPASDAPLPTAAGGAVITATPNPVPAGDGPGITTIAWNTGGDGSVVDVYLSIDGGAEKLFGTHSKDSKQIDWILPGRVYEFRMYPTGEHDTPLGSVKVTRDRK